jgi:tetratricopeptide (TPR) repeat protein
MLVTRLAQPVSLIPEVYAMTTPRVRLIVPGDSLAFYARQVLLPARLALDYGRSPDVVAARPWAWLAWLVPAALFVALWLLRRRARPLVVGVVVFFIGLIPVLGLLPFGAQLYSSVADHYLYLPMVGLALSAAWLASLARPRVALAVAAPVALALAVRSWKQTGHWRDTRALFEHNLRVNPRSWTSHINLAADALLRHDAAAAEGHARAALALRPGDGRIYTNLGVALGMQSRTRDAADALRRAVELVPQDPTSHYWLGQALAQLGRFDEAERHFRESLRLDPRRTDTRDGLARLRVLRRATTTSTNKPTMPATTRSSDL